MAKSLRWSFVSPEALKILSRKWEGVSLALSIAISKAGILGYRIKNSRLGDVIDPKADEITTPHR